eukprot:c32138_g1_i1 orf=68-277(+)
MLRYHSKKPHEANEIIGNSKGLLIQYKDITKFGITPNITIKSTKQVRSISPEANSSYYNGNNNVQIVKK